MLAAAAADRAEDRSIGVRDWEGGTCKWRRKEKESSVFVYKLSGESLSRPVKTLSAHKQADFLEILEISLQTMQNLDSALASSTVKFAVD